MRFHNLASAACWRILITLFIASQTWAGEDGKVLVRAGEVAALAETHLRLPQSQIVVQKALSDGQWQDFSEIEIAVGAHPNRPGSTDSTTLRIAPLSRDMMLAHLEFSATGIFVNKKEDGTDVLTWLKKPTPDHYYSALISTPRSQLIAGERRDLGFFFAAEGQSFYPVPTVGSIHYWESYARAVEIVVPRGAAMDDQKAENERTPLEQLAQKVPIPGYVQLVQAGGPELLSAVDQMTAQLLDEIVRKTTAEGIVPSEIALEQLEQQRLRMSGNPNPPNLQEYLAPFLAERAGAPNDSPTPTPEALTTPQPQSIPTTEQIAPQTPEPNRARYWWVIGGVTAAGVIGIAAWFARKRLE